MKLRTRVVLVAAAAVAVALPFLPGGAADSMSLSFLAAVFIVAEFTGGWRAVAAASATLAAVTFFIAMPVYPLMLVAACALSCARAMRAGAPLVICVLVLAGAQIAADILVRDGSALTFSSALASAMLNATLNVAVTCLFVRIRAPGVWLPPRRRWRFEDALFLAVAAALVPATLLLPVTEDQVASARDWWLAGTVFVILAAIALTGLASQRVVHALRGQLRDGRLRAVRRRSARLPHEMAFLFLSARRINDGLQRRSAIQGLHLESARMKTARLKQQIEVHERDRRRVEQDVKRLRESTEATERQWRDFLNTVPEALLVIDLAGRIEFANDGVRQLLGYSPERLVGTAISAMVPAARSGRDPLDLRGMLTLVDRDEPDERSLRFCDADGVLRELSAHIREFQAPQGRRIGIRLREATAAMQRARDQFVASMSHEIRTPLHGLMATLDMLRGEGLSNEGRRQLGIARTSAKTLMKIANDVLDLTRISAGGMPVERKPMSIDRLVNDVADEARSREEASRLRISAQVAPEVPPAVMGDPLRIKQVLRNLVSNALKFTSAGGVSIVAHWSGGICTIDVTDTGAGIAPGQRESIFQAFVQADRSVSRRHGGAGLGLAIGRQLSEAMQGSLSLLHSGPSGSTFRMVLPLPETDEAPLDEQSQRNLPAVKGRILVAEDDEASRYVAQTLLESLECPAHIVANGIDALEALRSGEFDLALLDCEMPGLDGYEVTTRIRKSGSRIPIIAMTASTMSADRRRCFDSGMDDLLPKPFGKTALSDMLAKWLSPQPRDSSQAPLAQELARRPELDPGVFDELRQSLNWQIPPLQKIYVSVRESARLAIESLAGGVPPDLALAQRRLHSLQGGAGLVGARQIEFVAARLLKTVKEGSLREVKESIPLLLTAVRRFEKVIDTRLDSLSAR